MNCDHKKFKVWRLLDGYSVNCQHCGETLAYSEKPFDAEMTALERMKDMAKKVKVTTVKKSLEDYIVEGVGVYREKHFLRKLSDKTVRKYAADIIVALEKGVISCDGSLSKKAIIKIPVTPRMFARWHVTHRNLYPRIKGIGKAFAGYLQEAYVLIDADKETENGQEAE